MPTNPLAKRPPLWKAGAMFLRHKLRRKDGKEHRYWSIVEPPGIRGRTVQRHVLYLGEINDSQRAAWCQTIEAFDEQAERQTDRTVPRGSCGAAIGLRCGACPASGLRLRRPRQWGGCWLACHLGISFNWMSSGHHVCRYRDRGHAG